METKSGLKIVISWYNEDMLGVVGLWSGLGT